jgi:hypothetical protein
MADQKFGRNRRAASNAGQSMRTARNKRRNAEKAHAEKIAQPSVVDYKRGAVRVDKAQKHADALTGLRFTKLGRIAAQRIAAAGAPLTAFQRTVSMADKLAAAQAAAHRTSVEDFLRAKRFRDEQTRKAERRDEARSMHAARAAIPGSAL